MEIEFFPICSCFFVFFVVIFYSMSVFLVTRYYLLRSSFEWKLCRVMSKTFALFWCCLQPPKSWIFSSFIFFYLHLHCSNAEYILAFNVRLHINCDRRWFFRLIEWWYCGNCICIEQTNLIMLMAIHFGLCIMLTIDSLVSALRNATMFESNTIPLWQVVKLTEIRLEIIFLNLYSGS